MSRKEEILREAEKQRRLEAERKKLIKDDKPLRIRASGMPLGCWMWVLFAIWGIGYLIFRSMKD